MVVRAGREFLAIPGPTTVPDEVLRAMHRPAIDIYSGEMVELTEGLLRDLGRLFATTGRCYIYISNGHGAWEATISNALSRGDKVLVLESGRFAVNWGSAAAAMGADVEVLKGDFRRAVRPADVEARLRQDRDHRIKAIMVAHVDTASGVVNDIEAIGKAIRACGHPALYMVDAVASLGCMPFEMDAWGIDIAMSGSQKGLMSPPGLGFVAANERALAEHRNAGLRTPYWDWTERDRPEHYRKYAGTAPVHLLFALRQAFDMLFAEGLDQCVPAPPPARRGGAPRGCELVRGPGARPQHQGTRRARRHRHDSDGVERPRSGRAATLLQGEVRARARDRHRRTHRPVVSDRPYGSCQCADDPGHAGRCRGRAEGARHPARHGRHRCRDRMARRKCQGLRASVAIGWFEPIS